MFVDLSIALAEAGHDTLAICQKGSEAETLLKHHGSVSVLPIRSFGWWDMAAAFRIRAAISKYKSDVVQAHLLRAAYLTGKACKWLNKPLLVTTHNYVNTNYYRHVDMLVPPTDDQKRYLISKGIPESRITRIDHFSNIIPVEDVAVSANPTKFIAFGRFVKKKGFDVLLKAFKELLVTTDEDIRLILGGDGPEKNNLEQITEDLGIEERVSFPGWIDDIESFLKQGELFVLPSLDEPFGIVVLEAMAMGLPIITTETKGPLEILSAETAVFAATNNVASLADAMEKALNSESQRQSLASKALQRFKERYSRQAIIPQFETLYASLSDKLK